MGRTWAVAGGCILALFAGSAPNGVTLEVLVRSITDSTPIRGAEIVVERIGPGSASSIAEDLDDRVITRAESNERGEIVLRELPAVPMRLKLRAEGFVSPALDDFKGHSRKRLELVLSPAIEVTGIVVDETGKAVPNVTVELPYVLDMNTRVVLLNESPSATTDAAGEFRLKGVPEGIGKFAVTTSGYSLLDGEGTHRLSKHPIRLRLRPTGVIRVDIDAPLHLRGQYTIKVQRRNASGPAKLIQERPSADRGAVSFLDVPAGQYLVSAEIPSRRDAPPTLTATANVAVGKTTEVVLTSKK